LGAAESIVSVLVDTLPKCPLHRRMASKRLRHPQAGRSPMVIPGLAFLS
jgi:hypothetical protein